MLKSSFINQCYDTMSGLRQNLYGHPTLLNFDLNDLHIYFYQLFCFINAFPAFLTTSNAGKPAVNPSIYAPNLNGREAGYAPDRCCKFSEL